MLASRGLDPTRIQSLGRWRSSLVAHYAGESLATSLAAELAAADPLARAAMADADTRLGELRSLFDGLSARLDSLADARPSPSLALPPSAAVDPSSRIAQNAETLAGHLAVTAGKTRCGWPWSRRPHFLFAEVPVDAFWRKICKRCLPLERQARKLAQRTTRSEVETSSDDREGQ